MTTSPQPPTPSENPPEPTASPEQSAQVSRRLITLSLAVGTLGLAVPFGSSSGPFVFEIDPLEIFITLLALCGAVGLVLDFFHPWRSWFWRTAFAEMAVGFLWVSAAIYELIQQSAATIEWRAGHGLIYFGYAVLALTSWRWINRGNTRG